ncbi:MAG: LCP family protein [Thermoleophilia bacterium]|nr:LCP family protein [Thermoleophilia bacterium]
MGAARSNHGTRARASWRSLWHALLSAVLPGAGQLAAGAKARGFAMVAASVFVAAAAGIVAVVAGLDNMLAWVIAPSVLLLLILLDGALLAFRVFAVVDAYRVPRRSDITWPPQVVGSRVEFRAAQRQHRASLAAGLLLALLVLFTAVPHLVAGYYLYVSRDLVMSVFSSEGIPGGSTDVCTTVVVSHTESRGSGSLAVSTTGSSATSNGGTSTTYPVSSSTAASTGASEPGSLGPTSSGEEIPVVADDDGRLTVLLIGTDAGYGRSGARADSIMVATANLETGRVALFGIARNTGSVPLSQPAARALGTKVYLNLISSLYSDAREHPELAPEGQDPGAVVLRDTVSMLLGIPIDYYAVVDMGGFVKVVDALGGVTLNVKERVQVRLSPPTPDEEWRVYDIEPGVRHLSGLEALAFARSRTGSSDYVRMGRQRCILAALLYQNGAAEFLLKFPKLAEVIKDSVKTDVPLETIQALIKSRSRLKADEIITVGFTRPKYTTGINSMGYNILDVDLVQRTVREIIEHPEEVMAKSGTDQSLDTYDCWKVK